ncbi:MAG: HAD family phosphatase [Cyanobacteria bacterium J06606_4]
MALKVVLFSFSGVIINDESIRQMLSNQLLLDENLRPDEDDYTEMCLGKSDRACLKGLLSQRGRMVNDDMLAKLLTKKTAGYQAWVKDVDKLPLYPGLDDLIFRCRAADIKMGIVTGSQRQQVLDVLARAELADHFQVIIAGDDLSAEGSKPSPEGYTKAIAALNQTDSELQLQPQDCIAIEDSFAGIEAAKAAQIPVVGVAHVYPNHMLQRRANWVVDYLREIKFDWIGEHAGGKRPSEEEDPMVEEGEA